MITQTKEMADARRKWLFAKKMALRAQSEGRFNTIYETSTRVHRADYLRLRSVWNAPAAALAEAEAEVARLRAALDKCARLWPGLGCTIPEEWMSKERHYRIGFEDGLARVSRIARAALETAPAGEA